MRFLPFVWLNMTRNKLRAALTSSAIAVAITLVCLLLTMPSGLDALLASAASNTRIGVHHEAGLVYSLPYSYLQKIRSFPGITAAASWTWYGGVFEIEKGITFPSFAVEPDALGTVWADWKIDAGQLEAFRRYRDGAIVGRGTLLRQGWQVGDRVTLRGTLFPVDLDFQLVGEIPDVRSPHFLFQREYLDQALRPIGAGGLDILHTVWVRVDDRARVEPLMREIDDSFRNSEARTASETETSIFKNFFGALEGLVKIILLVSALVTICIVFIAANTTSMAVRERRGEIAVLRALGFGRFLIFGMLLAESTLLSVLSGALGAAAALGVTWLVRARAAGWDPQLGPLGNFIVTNEILLQALLLALAVGVISGIVPALGAARRGVATALREVF